MFLALIMKVKKLETTQMCIYRIMDKKVMKVIQ